MRTIETINDKSYHGLYMKGKVDERNKAIALRKIGYSINEIVRQVDISKGTASLWLRDIELTDSARQRLIERSKLGPIIAAEKKRQNRKVLLVKLDTDARKELSHLNISREIAKVMCVLIYWCEGTKDSANGICFANSDPQIVQTFLNFFRGAFAVKEDKFRVCVHLHEYHDIKKQLEFWSAKTKIPLQQFIKPYMKPHTGKRVRENYPGCVSIRYRDNAMARKVLSLARMFMEKYT